MKISVLKPSVEIAELILRPMDGYDLLYDADLMMEGEVIATAWGAHIHEILDKMGLGEGYKLVGDYYETKYRMEHRETFSLSLQQEAVISACNA